MAYFVNIHGSASPTCDPARLARAHAFVREVVRLVLGDGGGVVVFLSGEVSEASSGLPLWFDWAVAEEAHRFCLERGITDIRLRVITGVASPTRRHPVGRSDLFHDLCRHGFADVESIREQAHSGGAYRKRIVAHADAIVAIGGTKGVTSLFEEHGTQLPILPMDIDLGWTPETGRGALELREMALTEPERLFRHAPNLLRTRIRTLALERDGTDAAAVAREAFALLNEEWAARSLLRLSRHGDPIRAPADRAAFVALLERDVHAAVRELVGQRHQVQRWTEGKHCHEAEESLRSRLLAFLRGRGYDVNGEADEGGSTDLLVREDRLGLLWIGECKVHTAYDDLEQGMLQLHTRYASGTHSVVAFVVFCFNRNAAGVLAAWKARILERKTCGLLGESADDPEHPLAFSTRHQHVASGLELLTRHIIVPLYQKPEDRSGKRARGEA